MAAREGLLSPTALDNLLSGATAWPLSEAPKPGSLQDRPCFHIAGAQGWVNDPNGPLLYNGVYHMFFQHLPAGCAWDWGLVWGHAVSKDLVHWSLLDPALEPTPGGMDGDGCFSGCATVDTDGSPVILYTGVQLKSSPLCGPLPPAECDLGVPMIEMQGLARACSADPNLAVWSKEDAPFLPLPPPNLNLTAWRDPFVLGRPGGPGQGDEWTLMIGAGIKDTAGTALVYRSKSLSGGWRYVGELCRGPGGSNGTVWECPVLVKLPNLPKITPATTQFSAGQVDMSLYQELEQLQLQQSGSNSIPQQQSSKMHSGRSSIVYLSASTSLPDPLCRSSSGFFAWDTEAVAAVAARALTSGPSSNKLSAALSGDGPLKEEDVYVQSPLYSQAGATTAAAGAKGPFHAAAQSGALINGHAKQTDTASSSANGTLHHAHSSADIASDDATASPDGAAPAVGVPTAEGQEENPYQYLFSICPENCQHPALYYLGRYTPEDNRFDLDNALGPFPLDMGDIFYAPNTLPDDGKGRTLLWGWLQEQRKVGTYDYAGCLSLPRAMWLHPGVPLDPSPAPAAGSEFNPEGTPLSVAPATHQPHVRGPHHDHHEHPHLLQERRPPAAMFSETVGRMVYGELPVQFEEGETPEEAVRWAPGDTIVTVHGLPVRTDGMPFLVQEPLAEMAQLRKAERAWVVGDASAVLAASAPSVGPTVQTGAEVSNSVGGGGRSSFVLHDSKPVPIPQVGGSYLDIELMLQRGSSDDAEADNETNVSTDGSDADGAADDGAATAAAAAPASKKLATHSGVMLHSTTSGAESRAAVLYHWDTGVLEVVWESQEAQVSQGLLASLTASSARRVGGPLLRPPPEGQPLSLRIFIDYSLVEVFTGGGEVLTARVYRGPGPATPGSGLELLSLGGDTTVLAAAAYEVSSIWDAPAVEEEASFLGVPASVDDASHARSIPDLQHAMAMHGSFGGSAVPTTRTGVSLDSSLSPSSGMEMFGSPPLLGRIGTRSAVQSAGQLFVPGSFSFDGGPQRSIGNMMSPTLMSPTSGGIDGMASGRSRLEPPMLATGHRVVTPPVCRSPGQVMVGALEGARVSAMVRR